MATEQCEFLSFEIEKIENINPQVGEYEELLKIKKQLSKKEKIANLLSTANEIFNYESVVHKTLDELEINSDFFNETMINLKSCFEDINSQFEELESINIEEILSRLSILSDLNRKYGSIENILIVKDNKRIELEKYQNISFEKDKIVLEIEKISQTLEKFANQITTKRVKAIKKLSKTINEYAQMLYLSEVNLSIVNKELSKSGQDEVTIFLDNTTLKSISSGEFNRLRLALICANNELSSTKNNGILILDEIDSNLSGKESQSVANVLNILSKNYQILSISHQPQLTSVANQHFIVEKDSNKSIVRELNFEQRVDEIARMISSDKVTVQAKDLAKELLNS
jgi:DNA repair protein RecN (Recombination protein N)